MENFRKAFQLLFVSVFGFVTPYCFKVSLVWQIPILVIIIGILLLANVCVGKAPLENSDGTKNSKALETIDNKPKEDFQTRKPKATSTSYWYKQCQNYDSTNGFEISKSHYNGFHSNSGKSSDNKNQSIKGSVLCMSAIEQSVLKNSQDIKNSKNADQSEKEAHDEGSFSPDMDFVIDNKRYLKDKEIEGNALSRKVSVDESYRNLTKPNKFLKASCTKDEIFNILESKDVKDLSARTIYEYGLIKTSELANEGILGLDRETNNKTIKTNQQQQPPPTKPSGLFEDAKKKLPNFLDSKPDEIKSPKFAFDQKPKFENPVMAPPAIIPQTITPPVIVPQMMPFAEKEPLVKKQISLNIPEKICETTTNQNLFTENPMAKIQTSLTQQDSITEENMIQIQKESQPKAFSFNQKDIQPVFAQSQTLKPPATTSLGLNQGSSGKKKDVTFKTTMELIEENQSSPRQPAKSISSFGYGDSKKSDSNKGGNIPNPPQRDYKPEDIKDINKVFTQLTQNVNDLKKKIDKGIIEEIDDKVNDFFTKTCDEIDNHFMERVDELLCLFDKFKHNKEPYQVLAKTFILQFISNNYKKFSSNQVRSVYGGVIIRILGCKHQEVLDTTVSVFRRKFLILLPEFHEFDENKESYEDYLIELGFDKPGNDSIKPINKTNYPDKKARDAAAMKRFPDSSISDFFNRLDCYSIMLFAILGTNLNTYLNRPEFGWFLNKHRLDQDSDYSKHYMSFLKSLFEIKSQDHYYFSCVVLRNWINQSADFAEINPTFLDIIDKAIQQNYQPKVEKIFEKAKQPKWLIGKSSEFNDHYIGFRADLRSIVRERYVKNKFTKYDEQYR